MSNGPRSVVIVGGGIGGLTSALALADVGIESIVLERHESATDVGAGIQLSPNATRVLFQLGLQEALTALSESPSSMAWLDGETDKLLAQFPVSTYVNEKFDTPYLQVYRPDLIRILESKCENESRIDLRHATPVEELRQSNRAIILRTTSDYITADLCIAADGTNSTIRKYVVDSIEARLFAGFAYRAVIPLDQLDERFSRGVTRLWLNSAYHVVTYAVGEEPILNCVFVTESDDPSGTEDLHRQRATCNSLIDAITTQGPSLTYLLDHVREETLYRWPLFQFAPVRSSQDHPIALIGDAWHTTLPFAGQGAALAIEDAAALATCLSGVRSGSLNAQLERFEELRISRIRQVQAISARNRMVYHLKNPMLKLFRSWAAHAAYRKTTRRLFSYRGIDLKYLK